MAGERVRELAREEPEAFERVACMRDDRLKEVMLEILEDVNGGDGD